MNNPVSRRSPPEQDGERVRPMDLFRQGLYWSLGAVATAVAAAAVYAARDVLTRVLIALFLAISLDPAVRMLTRWHMRRGFAVIAVVIETLSFAAAFLQAMIPALVRQFRTMKIDFPEQLTNLQDHWANYRRIGDQFNVTSRIERVLASLPERLSSGVFGATGRVSSAVLSTLTVAVLTVTSWRTYLGCATVRCCGFRGLGEPSSPGSST
jgi:predicted PurR-regulated permease PerM